ncbi:MAG: response regulator [Bacteroidota bacterium]|nr:response regulator [Bacteroidota bacterium]MDP4190222.1 response regulator [Bacteroidota bacterium]MDP4195527.1 response regulator [Bacteroidota bacterium]
MKILIVEDDFISRLVLQKILTPYGSCDIAVNGIEAITAFSHSLEQGDPYDLICLDIMMPEMDGRDALKIIREKEKLMNIAPNKEVKIIMTTALGAPKDVFDAFYQGGCTSYLVKPIEKKRLIELLKDYKLID